MVKEVTIDERVYTLRSDGALPRFYRKTIGRDLFTDMQSMGDDIGTSLEALENITYGMIRYAGVDDMPDNVNDWLSTLSPFGLYLASEQIVELIKIENATQSHAKKKNAR